jgi:hypothetical protein
VLEPKGNLLVRYKRTSFVPSLNWSTCVQPICICINVFVCVISM